MVGRERQNAGIGRLDSDSLLSEKLLTKALTVNIKSYRVLALQKQASKC
jgi:hypothetical protein